MAFNLSYMFSEKERLIEYYAELFAWIADGSLKVAKVTGWLSLFTIVKIAFSGLMWTNINEGSAKIFLIRLILHSAFSFIYFFQNTFSNTIRNHKL